MSSAFTLMYHSVAEFDPADPTADPFQVTVTPPRFQAQLRALRKRGLRGVSMRELLGASPKAARRLVGLTFDDGYADFATEVVPTLSDHGFTATVFVLADRLGGSNGWESHGPAKPLMTTEQVRSVAAEGMEVASHGLRHVSLPGTDDAGAAEEISHSRTVLSRLLGENIAGFAYPYGHVESREVRIVREAGYDYACAIWRSPVTSRHALPRTYVGQRDGAVRLLAKDVKRRLEVRLPR